MIENLQERLRQGKGKQSKGAKFCASIRRTWVWKNTLKLSAKHLEDNNPKDIFKSAKNFLGKGSPKEDSSKTAIS